MANLVHRHALQLPVSEKLPLVVAVVGAPKTLTFLNCLASVVELNWGLHTLAQSILGFQG